MIEKFSFSFGDDVYYRPEKPISSGESLWYFQFKRLLESRGHEYISYPNKADIAIRYAHGNVQEDPCIPSRYNKIVSVHFFPRPWPQILETLYPNEVLCISSISAASAILNTSLGILPPQVYELGIPFGEFQPSRFGNKAIFWAAKTWRCEGDRLIHLGLLEWIKALDILSRELPVSVLIANPLESSSPMFPSYYLEKGLLKNVSFVEGMTYQNFSRYITDYSITLSERFSGSFLDSIFAGLVPVLYIGCAIDYYPREVLARLSNNLSCDQIDHKQIIDRVRVLTSDSNSFNKELDILREASINFTDDMVYTKLLNIVKE
jgi:hypothetical protein